MGIQFISEIMNNYNFLPIEISLVEAGNLLIK